MIRRLKIGSQRLEATPVSYVRPAKLSSQHLQALLGLEIIRAQFPSRIHIPCNHTQNDLDLLI